MKTNASNIKRIRNGNTTFWQKQKLLFQLFISLITARAFFCITITQEKKEDEITQHNTLQAYGMSEATCITCLTEALEIFVRNEEKRIEDRHLCENLKAVPPDFLKNLNINNIN